MIAHNNSISKFQLLICSSCLHLNKAPNKKLNSITAYFIAMVFITTQQLQIMHLLHNQIKKKKKKKKKRKKQKTPPLKLVGGVRVSGSLRLLQVSTAA